MSALVTWKSGIATYPHQSEYPSLWKGLRSAYCPFLGPTGSTLRTIGAYLNHGTLTDMAPASDWVIANGSHALDFDGLNDQIVVPQTDTLGGNGIHTIAMRFMVRNIPTFVSGNDQRIMLCFHWNANRGRLIAITDAQSGTTGIISYIVGDAGGFDVANSNTVVQENVWYDVVCTYDGTRLHIAIDGVRDVTETIGSQVINDDAPLTFPLQGGGDFDGQVAFLGFWDRELRTRELIDMHNDLYAFLRVRHKKLALSIVAAGVPTPYYYQHLLGT